MRLITDKILQTFESHGNLQLVLGVSTGQVTSSGDDLSEPVLTLVIPGACARVFSTNLLTAVSELLDREQPETPKLDSPTKKIEEFLGQGIKLTV